MSKITARIPRRSLSENLQKTREKFQKQFLVQCESQRSHEELLKKTSKSSRKKKREKLADKSQINNSKEKSSEIFLKEVLRGTLGEISERNISRKKLPAEIVDENPSEIS